MVSGRHPADRPRRLRSGSSLFASETRRSGGRTWASSILPSIVKASFIWLCPSRKGSA
jgi:hypothetical protein